MKKRLLALAVAFTLIMTETAAFPAMASAAEDKTADTVTLNEAAEETADGISDTEETITENPLDTEADIVSEEDVESEKDDQNMEYAGSEEEKDHEDEPSDEEADEADDETDSLLDESMDDSDDYEPVLPQDGSYSGYFPIPGHKKPVAVESDSDGFQDLEERYVPREFLNSLPLRNQNPYGACWAFSSIGLAEASLAAQGIKTGNDFSELHLAYFTYNSVTDPLGGTKGDVSEVKKSDFINTGGNYFLAGNTLASWVGAADESKAPYSQAGKVNSLSKKLDPEIAYDDSAHLENIYRVNLSENRDAVKSLIKQYGAGGINFFAADGSFGITEAKCYNRNKNSYYCDEYVTPNHAVMIVGWDDKFSRSNFNKVPEGDGAWLVRNSWTTGNFDNNQNYSGYFWLSYYDMSLAIEDEATFFIFNDADNYDHNYQYDGCPFSNIVCSTDKEANVFTVCNDDGLPEILEAVSFSLYQDADVDYTVDIYIGPASGNPESGEKVTESTTTGHATYDGMHTVKLKKPVQLNDGETFSVVISFPRNTNVPAEDWAETTIWQFSHDAEEGQSYVHSYGDVWYDEGFLNNQNLRIKAYTKDDKENIIPLDTITFSYGISDSGLTLNKEEGYQVSSFLSPSDATSKKLVWTSSDEGVATVDKNGFVTALAPGTAEITATAKVGGASSSFTVNVTKELTDIRIVPSKTGYLTVGKSYPFRIVSIPSGFSLSGNVSWSSDNENVARITDGELSVVGAGKATIKAELDDMSDQYTVYCVPDEPAVTATRNENTVNISFKPSTGAQKYLIYREPYDTGANVSGRTLIKEIVHTDGTSSYSVSDDISEFTSTASYYYTYIKYYVIAVPAAGSLYSSEGSACVYDLTKYYKSFKITYILGKSQNHPSNPSALVDEGYVPLKDAIPPEGYNFVGWKESTRGVFTDALPLDDWNWNYDPYMPYTVTAVIAPNKYQIRYFANGGKGTMLNTAAEYDKAVNLRANSFKKTGYEFIGWNTEPDGSGTPYKDKASIKNLTSEDGVVIRLYAMWGGAKFDVTLDANGGKILSGASYVPSKKIRVATEGKYMDLVDPERYGYRFTGWYTEKEGGTKVSNGDTVLDVDILYAHYEAIKSRAYFDGNGHPFSSTSIEVSYGSPYGDLPAPSSAGTAEFIGWFLESDCITKVTEQTVVKAVSDHTLYAGWREKIPVENPEMYIIGSKNSDGTYPESTCIELRCATPGAAIYYTIGNDEPDTKYTGPIRTYKAGMTSNYSFNVRAKAVKEEEGVSDDYTDSAVVYLQTALTIKPESLDDGDMSNEDKAIYVSKGKPSGIWVAGLSGNVQIYSGVALKPEVRVYYGKKLLQSGKDYKITYKNNTNAYMIAEGENGFNDKKAPCIEIALSGSYTGKHTEYFVINQKNIDDGTFSVPDIALAYDSKKVQKGTTKITFTADNGKEITLKAGTDFMYDYPGTDPGKAGYNPNAFKEVNEEGYTVNVTGKGNFTGTTSFKEIITGRNLISKATVKGIGNMVCTGNDITFNNLEVKLGGKTLIKDEDYSVEYDKNKDIGTASVIITGKPEKGYAGTLVKTFKITGIPMSKAKIYENTWGSGHTKYGDYYDVKTNKYIYTGAPFDVAGPAGSGEVDYGMKLGYTESNNAVSTLVKGRDYSVSYEKNVNAGTASVIFAGMGRFTGTMKKTFGIAPYQIAAQADPRVTVSCDDAMPYVKGGACPVPEVTYTGPGGATPVTLVNGTDYTVKYSDNGKITSAPGFSGKKPSATVTLKGNFKGTISSTFDIEKSDIGDLSLVAADKAWTNKNGNWQTSFKVYDKNGKTLSSGNDYNKDAVTSFASDTFLADGSFRKGGTALQKNDKVRPGTVLAVTVTAAPSGFYEGTLTGYYRIFGYDISKAKIIVNDNKPLIYNGSAVRPGSGDLKVVLKIGTAEEELGSGDYYIESYENNTGKGTGKITIRGIGRCGGVKTATFKIDAAK